MEENSENIERLKFLYFVLNSFDDRRSAIDKRATVVLAASSLALGLIFNQVSVGDFFYPGESTFYKIIIALIMIGFTISSCMSLYLIAPISRTRHIRRKEKMNPTDPLKKTLTWFYLLSDSNSVAYNNTISELTLPDIEKELCNQVIKISNLLKKRYLRLKSACNILYFALSVLLIYSLLKII